MIKKPVRSEHQRPDADKYVDFNCEHLDGYDVAEGKVMDPELASHWKERNLSREKRMELVCKNRSLAEIFFRLVRDYLIPSPVWEPLEHDEDYFDYGSIMMYGSLDLVREQSAAARKELRLPLLKKLAKRPVYDVEAMIFPGGHWDHQLARVSTMDVKRIAKMYPGTKDQQSAIDKLQPWEPWPAVQIEDPHFVKVTGGILMEPTLADIVDVSGKPMGDHEARIQKLWPDEKRHMGYISRLKGKVVDFVRVDMTQFFKKLRSGSVSGDKSSSRWSWSSFKSTGSSSGLKQGDTGQS